MSIMDADVLRVMLSDRFVTMILMSELPVVARLP
jgi:hypothetical protein